MTPPRVLIIAGSDSGGGAGIQADIKTVTMLGGHAMTAITAITAQNTMSVEAVDLIPIAMIEAQLQAVLSDLPPDAVKIGMIGSAFAAQSVGDFFIYREPRVPIVFDPVMVATSGAVLADDRTVAAFDRLMRLSSLITPNLPELKALTRMPVDTGKQRLKAATTLARENGCAVLAKGGHADGETVVDLLVDTDGATYRWEDSRIDTSSTHGTGCALSSAIATQLGMGRTLVQAVDEARAFVRAALRAAPGFGQGRGPMGHSLGTVPFDRIREG